MKYVKIVYKHKCTPQLDYKHEVQCKSVTRADTTEQRQR